jgi:hypothetical protein
MTTDNKKGKRNMAAAESKRGFSEEVEARVEELLKERQEELLARAVGALEDKHWREKVEKAHGALGDAVGPYVVEGNSGGPTTCTELCRTPSPKVPHGLQAIKPGRVVEIHPGDQVPWNSDWRKATPEEIATKAPIGVGLRVIEMRLPIGRAYEAKRGLVSEKARTRELISELEKRDAELGVGIEKAEGGIVEARKPLDTYLSEFPIEKQRAAIALSEELESERTKGSNPRYLGEHELLGDARSRIANEAAEAAEKAAAIAKAAPRAFKAGRAGEIIPLDGEIPLESAKAIRIGPDGKPQGVRVEKW